MAWNKPGTTQCRTKKVRLDEEGKRVRPEAKNPKNRGPKDSSVKTRIKFLKVRYKSIGVSVRRRKKALEV